MSAPKKTKQLLDELLKAYWAILSLPLDQARAPRGNPLAHVFGLLVNVFVAWVGVLGLSAVGILQGLDFGTLTLLWMAVILVFWAIVTRVIFPGLGTWAQEVSFALNLAAFWMAVGMLITVVVALLIQDDIAITKRLHWITVVTVLLVGIYCWRTRLTWLRRGMMGLGIVVSCFIVSASLLSMNPLEASEELLEYWRSWLS